MNIQNQKGITLIALTVTVILILILTTTILYNSNNQVSLKKINSLYNDIEILNTKIDEYYIKYGELPILCYYCNKENLQGLIQHNAEDKNAGLGVEINQNDDDRYYVIDVERLEGVSLSYGYEKEGEYHNLKEWLETHEDLTEENVDYTDYDELYVINSATHQIYFPHGILVDDYMYFTYRTSEVELNSETIVSEVSQGKWPTIVDTDIEFITEYATIDVIWLDVDNNVKAKPNFPKLASDMTKVTWTYDDDTDTWEEDETAQSTWYNYVAGDGVTDTKTSMWANAKMEDGSYFVWIPRYAYRITYYSNDPTTTENPTITGYFDGYGLWSVDGKLKYKLNEDIGNGIETVEHNGKKYIVHPAFETNLDNGGWDSDLAGIWVAKYEMSQQSSTDGTTWTNVDTRNTSTGDILTTNAGNPSTTQYRAVSVPNVMSWMYMSIGNQYLNGYNYDRAKESHMMKNSEWGAVAYLTQSQYGRNAHEIDINNSWMTGNGGGSTNASFAAGITNAYNTEAGAKASTTGNISGIYDMSGGTPERVTSYNSNTSSYSLDRHGKAMMDNAKDGENNYISTKYITKYTNPTDSIYRNSSRKANVKDRRCINRGK